MQIIPTQAGIQGSAAPCFERAAQGLSSIAEKPAGMTPTHTGADYGGGHWGRRNRRVAGWVIQSCSFAGFDRQALDGLGGRQRGAAAVRRGDAEVTIVSGLPGGG